MKKLYKKCLRTGLIDSHLLVAYKALRGQVRLVLSLSALLVCSIAWGQAPDQISYPSVVRDLNNDLIASQAVGVQITILQGAPNGANMYRERHSLTTNATGLLSLEIGAGAVQNGSLSAINWSMGPYFVERAIDPSGGTAYTLIETSQLFSVPYALHAQSADRANSAARADVATSLSAAGGGQLGAPIGMIVSYSGSAGSVPTGWLLCDGASYDVNIYPELFALIGTAYGSDPNRFKVPDLRGRSPMGRDANQAEFASLGQIGGAKVHALTIAEMPAHNHGGVTGSAGNHQHPYGTRGFLTSVTGVSSSALGMDGSGDDQGAATQDEGEHVHPIPSAGTGSPHNNLQPYLILNFIIKAN